MRHICVNCQSRVKHIQGHADGQACTDCITKCNELAACRCTAKDDQVTKPAFRSGNLGDCRTVFDVYLEIDANKQIALVIDELHQDVGQRRIPLNLLVLSRWPADITEFFDSEHVNAFKQFEDRLRPWFNCHICQHGPTRHLCSACQPGKCRGCKYNIEKEAAEELYGGKHGRSETYRSKPL